MTIIMVVSHGFLIAVGGWPSVPDIPGRELSITSNEIFDLQTLPKRVVIWGGGYIAVEFACILNGYGSDVHIVIRRDAILRGFDEDCRKHVMEQLEERDGTLHMLSFGFCLFFGRVGEENEAISIQKMPLLWVAKLK